VTATNANTVERELAGELGEMPVDHRAVLGLALNVWFLLLVAYLQVLPAGRFHVLVPIVGLGSLGAVARVLMVDRSLRAAVDPNRLMIVVFALVGLLVPVMGLLRGNPGWRDVAIALVAAPLAWFVLSLLPDRWAIERLPAAVGVGTIVTALCILLLVSGRAQSLIQILVPGAYGVQTGGITRVNFSGASALIVAVPFLATVAWDAIRHRRQVHHRWVVFAALGLGVMAAMVSGRQGVIGAMVLTPMLIAVVHMAGFRFDETSESKTSIATVVAGLAALFVGGLLLALAVDVSVSQIPRDLLAVVGIVDETQNARVSRSFGVRSAQAESLLEGFRQSPLVGQGGGAVAPDFYTWRGYEPGEVFTTTPRPWRAELSYHLLLFESGLLGLFAYLAAAVAAFRVARRRFAQLDDQSRSIVRAAMVMALSMVIATAANPLARTVGHQWSLFIPLIAIAVLSRPSTLTAADS